MTLLDDRPVEQPSASPPARAAVPSVARWRLASRLARREVRRRPGRTALVTLLVAVPVMGMTLGSVLGRTQADTWAEQFQRSAGLADVRLEMWSGSDPAEAGLGLPDPQLAALLPPGSTFERSARVYAAARSATDARYVQFLDLDVGSPLVHGAIEVRDGVAPATASEVALDPDTAREFGVSVGDTLRLESPAGEWTVTGIVRNADSFRDPLVVFGEFDWDRVAPASRGELVLIDLPASATVDETKQVLIDLQPYGVAAARDVSPDWLSSRDEEVSTEAMAWGWVAGALALCIVGTIIAAAFATSARRQLVTIGQLSANGAGRPLLRRTLALQGSWSGLIGSIVGVGLGLIALFALRDVAEFVVSHRLGAYEVAVGDMFVIVVTGVLAATVAALVPARGTARVPVMAALAGRRPFALVPRHLVPIGLILFGGGLFLLVLAASGSSNHEPSDTNLYAATAVLGGLGVLFGMCCVTPLVTDLVGRAGAHVSGSWRLSARSLARTRTRSAGVITAIAAAGALAAAGSTMVASSRVEQFEVGTPSWLPMDSVRISAAEYTIIDGSAADGTLNPPPYTPVPIDDALIDAVVDVTGGNVQQRRVAVWDPAPFVDGQDNLSSAGLPVDMSGFLVVADEELLDTMGLSASDRDRLETIGAMALFGPLGPDGSPASAVVLDVEGAGETTLPVAAPADPFESQAAARGTLVTEATARALGLDIVDDGVAIRSSDDLSTGQLRRLVDIQRGADLEAFAGPAVFDAPSPAAGDLYTQLDVQLPRYPSDNLPTALVQLAIAAAALLFTLFIVAIGLALSAAESRDERDVLVAIGAKPRTMRRVAAQKAVLLSLAGTLLAVPTGVLPIVAVLRSLSGDHPVDVSWPTMLLLVAAVPLVAGLVTWVGSAIAQRLRPVHMSSLHTD